MTASEHLSHFYCLDETWDKQKWGGKRDRHKTCSSSYLHSEVVELLVFVHLQECHCQPSLNALAKVAEPNIHVSRYKLKYWKERANIIPTDKYLHETEQNKQQNSQGYHFLLSWSSGHSETPDKNTLKIHFVLLQEILYSLILVAAAIRFLKHISDKILSVSSCILWDLHYIHVANFTWLDHWIGHTEILNTQPIH